MFINAPISLGGGSTLCAEMLVHELGHTFGSHHAVCVNNIHRGSFAWCDSASTDRTCSPIRMRGFQDYCSPFNVMGKPPKCCRDGGEPSDWQTRPYGMDAKVIYGWVNPNLVSIVDWDPSTSSYLTCTPSCSFLLQRSDVTALNAYASAVIFLQVLHPSGGGKRYFVMENRYDVPLLLIHWADIDPTGGHAWDPTKPSLSSVGPVPPWPSNQEPLGRTVLTDCHPETDSWADAGCSSGESIELNTGIWSVSMKMNVGVLCLEYMSSV